MNRLDSATRARILAALCEGMAVRPITRMLGVGKNTVQRLIRDAGDACLRFHDAKVRGLKCRRVQADETWCFVGARAKHVRPERRGEWGDTWLWASVCSTSKIVPAWYLGARDSQAASAFLCDLASRIDGRWELNTDGYRPYINGIAAAMDKVGRQIDYAAVIKSFATPNGRWNDRENRYAQPEVTSIRKVAICGDPDTETASTSFAERMNLGVRQHNRKMARLTNAHAKKREMLNYTLAISYWYYNWVRPHETLGGKTPAMANDLTDHRLSLADLVALLP
jgi:IS1 family transposase